MNKQQDGFDAAPRTLPDGTVKQTSTLESFLRLIIFALACGVCAIVIFYTLSLAHNPKQVFPEGFGFVVGFGILFGFLCMVEGGVLLWRLGSRGFESWWK